MMIAVVNTPASRATATSTITRSTTRPLPSPSLLLRLPRSLPPSGGEAKAEEDQVPRGEAAGRHHGPHPGHEARPTAGDLRLDPRPTDGVGVPGADREVQEPQEDEETRSHRNLA